MGNFEKTIIAKGGRRRIPLTARYAILARGWKPLRSGTGQSTGHQNTRPVTSQIMSSANIPACVAIRVSTTAGQWVTVIMTL